MIKNAYKKNKYPYRRCIKAKTTKSSDIVQEVLKKCMLANQKEKLRKINITQKT